MIHLKSDREIEKMVAGGKILTNVLSATLSKVKPGVTLLELDEFSKHEIIAAGAEPSFPKVPGYRWTLCTCVNDVVVHGIPTDYKVKEGDVVGIDCGVYYKGFHTDASWTVLVKGSDVKNRQVKEKFLRTGKTALNRALSQVKRGNYIWDISKAIQTTVEEGGYSVVRSLIGHGVGKQLHEEPEIPGFTKGEREKTPMIVEGMVLAVEVIYNMGIHSVVYKGDDGWTIATKDGTISGLFEATVALTSHGSLVLTPIVSGLSKNYGSSGNH